MTSKGSTVEMTGRGNRGKPNSGLPLFPPPLEIAKIAISTFPQRRLRFSFLRTYEPTNERAACTHRVLAQQNNTKRSYLQAIRIHVAQPSTSGSSRIGINTLFRLTPHWNHFLLSGSLLDWKMLEPALKTISGTIGNNT